MAYSTPLTAVANAALTAAQWNASVRDNILETPAAKATASGRIFVSTGANAIAERVISDATVATSQTTASTAYANLGTVGPAVTVTTGTRALVLVQAEISNTGTNHCFVGVTISGATTLASADETALQYQAFAANSDHHSSKAILFTTLTAGSNTFTCQYRVDAGTASFVNRNIIVVAL